MAAILSAGLALRWLRDEVFQLEGSDAYARMLDLAATVPPGSRGLVFLPYLAGERSPHLDPSARGRPARPDGVPWSRRARPGRRRGHHPRVLRRLPRPRRLGPAGLDDHARGGGGRSAEWQRIVADVFGLPVRHLESGEQAALGACLLAGGGVGALDPARAAADWARLGPVIEPDRARHDAYEAVYDVFRDGYPSLRAEFPKLGALGRASGSAGHPPGRTSGRRGALPSKKGLTAPHRPTTLIDSAVGQRRLWKTDADRAIGPRPPCHDRRCLRRRIVTERGSCAMKAVVYDAPRSFSIKDDSGPGARAR